MEDTGTNNRKTVHRRKSSSRAGGDLVHCPDPPPGLTHSFSQLLRVLAAVDLSWSLSQTCSQLKKGVFPTSLPLPRSNSRSLTGGWRAGGGVKIQPLWPNLGLLWRVSPFKQLQSSLQDWLRLLLHLQCSSTSPCAPSCIPIMPPWVLILRAFPNQLPGDANLHLKSLLPGEPDLQHLRNRMNQFLISFRFQVKTFNKKLEMRARA